MLPRIMNFRRSGTNIWLKAAAMLVLLPNMELSQLPSSAPKLADKDYPIRIDGTATLIGSWTCGGDAVVKIDPGNPAPKSIDGIHMVEVTAAVPDIECGNSSMNKHLRKALKMEHFPKIVYRANKYAVVDDGLAIQTSGDLTIAGVTKPIGIGAKLIHFPELGARVVGTVEINMLDYNVKPPSIFFGTLRVAKTVSIKFDTVVMLPEEIAQLFFPTRTNSN
jgi:polyisoprenoid-binding protein YceI